MCFFRFFAYNGNQQWERGDNLPIFQYGETETEHLRKKDKKLGAAIERIGPIQREVDEDLFHALVSSIISQQISTKAAITIKGRLLEQLGEITPSTIARAHMADIQKCGMSMRKAGYVKGISEAVNSGEIDIDGLHALPDEDVIAKLTALHGVGVWTAEMMLLFSLQRPDIVSWGDLAIRRGMMNVYGLKVLTKADFEKYRKRYAPYGSTASLYLWACSTQAP